LGLGQLRLFEPCAPRKEKPRFDQVLNFEVKPVPPDFTIWDRVIFDKGDITVKQFVDLFPEIHYGCTVDEIFFKQIKKVEGEATGGSLWSSFGGTASQKETNKRNEPKRISQLYEEQFGPIPNTRDYVLIDVGARNSDGDDAIIPLVLVKFR